MGLNLTPAEISLIIAALQWAITEGKSLFDAMQLNDMAALLNSLNSQLATVQKDRQTSDADIDARDKQLEQDLAKK